MPNRFSCHLFTAYLRLYLSTLSVQQDKHLFIVSKSPKNRIKYLEISASKHAIQVGILCNYHVVLIRNIAYDTMRQRYSYSLHNHKCTRMHRSNYANFQQTTCTPSDFRNQDACFLLHFVQFMPNLVAYVLLCPGGLYCLSVAGRSGDTGLLLIDNETYTAVVTSRWLACGVLGGVA